MNDTFTTFTSAWPIVAVLTPVGGAALVALSGHRPNLRDSWSSLAALVMLVLGVAKRRLADQIDSPPLRSEATMTLLDAGLAAGTAAGLGLNILIGWWWADPLAALVVAFICVGEARENLEEAKEWSEAR